MQYQTHVTIDLMQYQAPVKTDMMQFMDQYDAMSNIHYCYYVALVTMNTLQYH